MNRTVVILAAVLVALWVWQLLRRRRALRAAAQRIVDMLRTSFAEQHELQVIREVPEDLRPALDEAGATLAGIGLAHAFDFEDLTISRAAGLSIPVRVYVDPSAPITASIYHHPQAGRLFIDVSSTLSDGRIITTTTAADALRLENPPEMLRTAAPADEPLPQVVARHRRWLGEVLAASPGASASSPRNADELFDSARRMQRRKHEFRRGLGWITLPELTRLSNGREDVARITHQQIQRLLAREERRSKA